MGEQGFDQRPGFFDATEVKQGAGVDLPLQDDGMGLTEGFDSIVGLLPMTDRGFGVALSLFDLAQPQVGLAPP